MIAAAAAQTDIRRKFSCQAVSPGTGIFAWSGSVLVRRPPVAYTTSTTVGMMCCTRAGVRSKRAPRGGLDIACRSTRTVRSRAGYAGSFFILSSATRKPSPICAASQSLSGLRLLSSAPCTAGWHRRTCGKCNALLASLSKQKPPTNQ